MLRAALLTLAASFVAAPSVSDACSKRHQSIFELYETAEDVAYVVVRQVPAPTKSAPGAGRVTLGVQRQLKGKPRARLTAREHNTSCSVGFRPGKKAIVFLAADGEVVGHYDGYVEELARWTTHVDAWAAATDDAARLAVLLAAIDSPDKIVAFDGAFHLTNQPQLLARLDADARARLIAAAQAAPNHTALPRLLVRLRDASALGRLHPTQQAAAKAFVAVTAYERVTDPNALADAIRDGSGERDPNRIAALERCERVHGRELYKFTSYANGVAGHFWPKLAETCRTGTPFTY